MVTIPKFLKGPPRNSGGGGNPRALAFISGTTGIALYGCSFLQGENWTELDTFRHFLRGVHAGSPISPPRRLCLSHRLPCIPNWTELDTSRHFLGGVHDVSLISPPRRLWLSHRPPCIPNWTELDTFGHFFAGVHAGSPISPPRRLFPKHRTTHPWYQSQDSWQAQLVIPAEAGIHEQLPSSVAPLESRSMDVVS